MSKQHLNLREGELRSDTLSFPDLLHQYFGHTLNPSAELVLSPSTQLGTFGKGRRGKLIE